MTKNATRPLGMILAAALPSRNAAQRTKRRVIENKFVSVAQLRGIVTKRIDEIVFHGCTFECDNLGFLLAPMKKSLVDSVWRLPASYRARV